MKLKIDENLPLAAATALRSFDLNVHTVDDELLSGADDHTVAARSRAEGRILVTLDPDFADIRACPPNQYSGIVVLRLKAQDQTTVVSYVPRVALVLGKRNPVGELWIVEQDRIRFR